jgi:hypothetical protein
MINVYIGNDSYGFGIGVMIVDEISSTDKRIMRYNGTAGGVGMTSTWEPATEGVANEPTFLFGDDVGRELLQALVRHYHGSEDSRALRRDYDDERKRVDKLMTAMIINSARP